MGLSDKTRARLLLLLLPPTLMLGVTRALETPLLYIDTWVYYGFFLNLPDYKSTLFAGTYYGERLAWLLPGYAIHQLFEPATARAVLRIGLMYVVVGAFFFLTRHTVGLRGAVVGTIVMATAPATTAALTTNYVDGPAVAYNLLALAGIVAATRSSKPALWLAAAGAATTALVTCNLFLAALVPTMPAVYLYLASKDRAHVSRLDMVEGFRAYAVGAAAAAFLFGAINYSLDGRWNYLESSLGFAQTWVGQSNPWDLAGTAWFAGAFWLVVPMAVLACSLAKALVRRGDFADRPADLCWSLHFAMVWLIYVAWDFVRGFAVEYREYVSFMIPSMFLAVSPLVAPGLDRLSRASFWRLAIVLCVVLSAPYLLQPLPAAIDARAWVPWLMAGAIAGLGVLTFARRKAAVVPAALALVVIHFVLVRLTPEHAMPSEARADRETIRRIHAASEAVIQRTDGRRVYFWYNRQDPLGDEFRALHSTFLFEYSSLHDQFPAIPVKPSLSAGMQVLVLTSHPPAQALSEAASALSAVRLSSELVGNVEIGSGPGRFQMLFLRLTEAPQAPPVAISSE